MFTRQAISLCKQAETGQAIEVSPVFSFTWLFLLQDVADVTIPDDMRRMAYWQKILIATRQTSQPIYMIIKNIYF